jgi:hypothetical protein
MNSHEYQSRELFAQYAMPIPRGLVIDPLEGAVEAGLGNAGGVKVAKDLDIDRLASKGEGSKVCAGAKTSAAAGVRRRS